MVKYEWGIFWADLKPAQESEQSGKTPVLVISAEEANDSLPIVTVISLISLKTGRKVYPIEALLPAEDTGLSKDSIAMAHQIQAVSKERLGKQCGYIKSENTRKCIKQALKLYLDLL